MADTPPRNLPPKKEVALALLEGDSVFIHLDPRKDGVVVPKSHLKQAQLVLQVGLNLAIRIPDLTIDDEGVSCTLSFNRVAFWCLLPWGAIYALVGPDGRGMLWPEDVPPEVAAQMRAGRAAKPREASARKPRPKLAAVADVEEHERQSEGKGEATPPAEQPRPAPRLVKRPQARPALAPVPTPGGPRARPPLGAHQRPSSPTTQERGAAERGDVDRGRGGGSPPPRGERTSQASDPKRPKRELPPYLRIVK